MTLEEKAKEYCEEYFDEFRMTVGDMENAYIAGATENGVVWHDLRKNPEDLPEILHPVYAKLDSGTYVFAYCVNKTWHDNDGGTILCHGNGECGVIAWCEIPKFEEEVNK